MADFGDDGQPVPAEKIIYFIRCFGNGIYFDSINHLWRKSLSQFLVQLRKNGGFNRSFAPFCLFFGFIRRFYYSKRMAPVFLRNVYFRRGMAVYGYLQVLGLVAISIQSGPRADGAFGNASYMAIFMVFAVFISAYLYFSEDKKWLKNIFGGLALIEIPVVFLTATRGAILGLIGGIMLFVLLLAFFTLDRRVKIASFGVITGVIFLISFFLLVQNKNFITQNPVFSRFSNLSFQDRTVQSRFTIWSMSFEGFKEKPALGWGIENYNQVFNKYYRPSLWPQEPWFDRSHNIIFDWLISAGLLGLLAYLSIFVSAVYMLWRGYNTDKNDKNLTTAVVFTSLFAAYTFHNFFVFDNLISYILFFTVLAFIHFNFNQKSGQSQTSSTFTPAHSFLAAILVFALFFALYFLNIKPLLANTALLQMLKDAGVQGQNVDLVLSDFDKSVNYRTFGMGEAREQLSSYASAVSSSNLTAQVKEKVLQKAASEFEKQIKDAPYDARTYIFLSSMYERLGRYDDSLATLNKALDLSPKKQQIHFLIADDYLAIGQSAKAFEIADAAYNLDPTYPNAVKNLAAVAIVNGQDGYAREILIKNFGTDSVADAQLLNAYVRVGNFTRARDIWIEFIKQSPNNPQYRVNLAATYFQLGERSKSIQELERAIELNPQFKETGEYLINEIKAGRNPS